MKNNQKEKIVKSSWSILLNSWSTYSPLIQTYFPTLHYAASHDISIPAVTGCELTFGRSIHGRSRHFLVATSSAALETPILLFLQVHRELAECKICRSDARKPGAQYQHWPQSVWNGAGVFWLQFCVAFLIIVLKSTVFRNGKGKDAVSSFTVWLVLTACIAFIAVVSQHWKFPQSNLCLFILSDVN